MQFYVYDSSTCAFKGEVECDVCPENATDIKPPMQIANAPIAVIWNKVFLKWEYREYLQFSDDKKNNMNDSLDYAAARCLDYPPLSEYVDAMVKNDSEQLQSYTMLCIEVKNKWPKTMNPISRRDYYIRTIDMIPYNL
jgi:hypothetical protein